MSETSLHRRLIAKLDVVDGYPPADREGLWCVPDGIGTFVLDSIPFFVDGLALGDVVSAEDDENEELILEKVERSGGHSTVRVVFFGDYDINEVQRLRNEIVGAGCESEFDLQRGIVAIDVPSRVELAPLESMLNELEKCGRIEWWVGVLRHT